MWGFAGVVPVPGVVGVADAGAGRAAAAAVAPGTSPKPVTAATTTAAETVPIARVRELQVLMSRSFPDRPGGS